MANEEIFSRRIVGIARCLSRNKMGHHARLVALGIPRSAGCGRNTPDGGRITGQFVVVPYCVFVLVKIGTSVIALVRVKISPDRANGVDQLKIADLPCLLSEEDSI